MDKLNKDIYHKKYKYKSKYLELKKQLLQFGGGPCDWLIEDASITSDKLLKLDKLIYLNKGQPVGHIFDETTDINNISDDALRISPENTRLSYADESTLYNRILDNDSLRGSVNEFITKCGIYLDYQPLSEKKLYIMPNDILIPVCNYNMDISYLFRFVLAGVKRASYIIADASGNLRVGKQYSVTSEHNHGLLKDIGKIFDVTESEMHNLSDLPNADILRTCIGSDIISTQCTGRIIFFCGDSKSADIILKKLNIDKNLNNIYVVDLNLQVFVDGHDESIKEIMKPDCKLNINDFVEHNIINIIYKIIFILSYTTI